MSDIVCFNCEAGIGLFDEFCRHCGQRQSLIGRQRKAIGVSTPPLKGKPNITEKGREKKK